MVQPALARALEVAACGHHSVMVVSPRGCGARYAVELARNAFDRTPDEVTFVAPCPCGGLDDRQVACSCEPDAIRRHKADWVEAVERCDIGIEATRPRREEVFSLIQTATGQREETAFDGARANFNRARPWVFGGENGGEKVPLRETYPLYQLSDDVVALITEAHEQYALTHEGVLSVLRVAQTIRCMEGAERLAVHHAAEAVQYKTLASKWRRW
jgi:magnesium chelatase family protein